jgi:hypothetical protein
LKNLQQAEGAVKGKKLALRRFACLLQAGVDRQKL